MSDEPVHLVACGMNQKKSGIWPAKELYTSKRFALTRNDLERSGQLWFILSTAHGLIAPNDLKAPYDQSLNSFDRPTALAWAQQVRDKLHKLIPDLKEVIFHDTGRFRQVLSTPLSELLQKQGVLIRQG